MVLFYELYEDILEPYFIALRWNRLVQSSINKAILKIPNLKGKILRVVMF